MFAVTHSVIAVSIANDLKSKHNIDIKGSQFLWGNIKPDIVSTYIEDSHYKESSVDSVVKRIIEMSEINPEDIRSRFNNREFLVRLGIIARYVSDYFCLPHNSNWRFFQGYTKEHISYETKLDTISKNINFSNFHKLKDIKLFKEEEIKLLLDEADELYKKRKSFGNDINFAINVCIHIIRSIIDKIFNATSKTIFV